MRQHNEEIESLLQKALQDNATSNSFDEVWGSYKGKRKVVTRKKRITIPLIALLSVMLLFTGFATANVFRNIDKTDYPFVEDNRVIGKWDSVDFVRKIDDFAPTEKTIDGGLFLNSLVFIKDGKMLTSSEKSNLAYTTFTWTKDLILSKQEKTASKYEIKDIDGSTYLFFEWKSGDYIFRNQTPCYYVLKKADNKDYSDYTVKSVKEDKVDYEYVNDTDMLGQWEAVDFVKSIDSYVAGEKSWPDDLFVNEINIKENGELTIASTKSTLSGPRITWTKGMILDSLNKTASKCEIKEIDGSKYMFYEWKNGDYIYRGAKPYYYVLKKID